MGLDFTGIKDHDGSAIYLIHDGSEENKLDFEKLSEDLKNRSKKQVILLSTNSKDGNKIINFYQLRGTKFVLIVRDDDQLHHVWSDGELFDASKIAYTAEQAG